MSLGKRIQSYRKQRGLSQEQLASLLNVSRQALSKWEQDINVPNVEKIIEVAKKLDVSINELLGIEGETNNEYAKLESILNQLVLTQNNEIKRNKHYLMIGSIIAMIVILVGGVVLWGFYTNIIGLRNSNSYLNRQFAEINNQLSTMSGSISTQIQEQLQIHDSLLSSFEYKIENIDFDSKTMLVNFDLVFKEYDNNNVTISFNYEHNEQQSYPLTLENGHFKMSENLPIDNILSATVTIQSDTIKSQVIKDPASHILESLMIEQYYSYGYEKIDGKYNFTFDFNADNYESDLDEEDISKWKKDNRIVKATVVYRIDAQEKKAKVKISNQNELSFKIPEDNLKKGNSLDLEITYEDKLEISRTITVSYNVGEVGLYEISSSH